MAWKALNIALLALFLGMILYGAAKQPYGTLEGRRSPAYAIADELEAISYNTHEMTPRMEDARRRWAGYPSVYLDNPGQWPKPGTVGVWINGHDVIVRWIDPSTGVKTSAHRVTAE
jgi:hypothetical protein